MVKLFLQIILLYFPNDYIIIEQIRPFFKYLKVISTNMSMAFYITFLFITFTIFLKFFGRYPGTLIGYIFRRFFKCRRVQIEGLGLFSANEIKTLLYNGLKLELCKLRLDKIFDWRPGQRPSLNLQIFIQEFRIGKITYEDGSEKEKNIELEEKCGCFEKVSICFCKLPGGEFQLSVRFQSQFEFTWSPVLHLMCLDIFRALRSKLVNIFNIIKSFSSSNLTRSSTQFLFDIQCEHSVQLTLCLPKKHMIRLIVPSFKTARKAPCVGNFAAPNLLVEMDGNIIMNVEQPAIECVQEDLLLKVLRREFVQLKMESNRVWSWSADLLQIVFPYGYNFANAFEELVNSIKWIKLIHSIKKVPFTVDSPLPADVRIHLKRFSLRLDDDPFEIQLQNIYEVQMDEIFERERRKQILDAKISQLKKEDTFFPNHKVEALHQSLIKKDGQLYVERIRKVRQQQQDRCLFQWTIEELELRAFADIGLIYKWS